MRPTTAAIDLTQAAMGVQQHRLLVYSLGLLVATEVAWTAADDSPLRSGKRPWPASRFGEVTTIPTQAVDKDNQRATRSSPSTMANRHQSQPLEGVQIQHGPKWNKATTPIDTRG